MRLNLPLLAFILGLMLALSHGQFQPTHLLTNAGNFYDVSNDQTCYKYTFTCNAAECPPITGFDLDCNCPVTASYPEVDANSNTITWDNSTNGSPGGVTHHLGETFGLEFCVGGNISHHKHSKFVIKAIIIIVIGEIIVPDCHPKPTICPTACPTCPTPTPTSTPTPTPEPTQPQGEGCELIVTPSSLQINDTAQIQVSLADNPDGLVSVTVSSTCVLLSSCLLTFDSTNFNIPQVITVYRNPAFPGNNCTIELVASGAAECNATIPVTILPQNLTPAQSWADPHIMTFDGIYYRAFSTGDYYFVRQFNSNLIVQTRQTRCGPASCNTAVAVRFGTLEFYLTLGANGNVGIQIVGNAAANGVTITNTDPYRIYFPGGGYLTIRAISEGTNNFLNLVIYLPDFYQGQVGGLAGEFNGNPADDFTLLVSGVVTTNQTEFIASTLVPPSENLFDNSGAVIPLIRGATPQPPVVIGETCTPFTPANDMTAFLQANQAFQSPLSGAPLAQVANPGTNCTFQSEELRQRATSTCARFFTADIVSCCRPFGVTQDTYYQSCLCDYALIQNADFVYAHLLAFLSTCEAAANSQHKSCAAFASQIEDPGNQPQGSCGSNPCLNGGVCTETAEGYECNCQGTGFNGNRCQRRIACLAIPLEDHAFWQQAFANGISWGKCEDGYLGQPYRSCLETGLFGPITNPCVSASTQCAGETYHNAAWPPTNINTYAQGICAPGFGGDPLRLCKVYTGWTSYVLNHCKRLYCTNDGAGGATWKTTAALKTATGRCNVGYGLVSRTCQADGSWGDIEGECAELSSIPCPTEVYNRAVWPPTEPGQSATGTCIAGWTGSPTRTCGLDGRWQDLVRNHCIRV